MHAAFAVPAGNQQACAAALLFSGKSHNLLDFKTLPGANPTLLCPGINCNSESGDREDEGQRALFGGMAQGATDPRVLQGKWLYREIEVCQRPRSGSGFVMQVGN